MNNWIVIIIVIAALIVLYLLSALILYLLMKRVMGKAYDALMALVPHESQRLQAIEDLQKKIRDDNYRLSDEMVELCQNTRKILDTKPVDVAKAKGQIDFLLMYHIKFIKEKRLVQKREGYKEIVDKLTAGLHLKDDLKNSPYGRYDKLAMRYNAYLGMFVLAPFVRGKYKNAPIL